MGCVSSKTADNDERKAAAAPPTPADDAPKQLDSRLPFAAFRDFFTLKNYWKAVSRKEKDCAKQMLYSFLVDNDDFRQKYGRLAKLDFADRAKVMESTVFEKIALEYLQIFDDVMSAIESSPSDCSQAIDTLQDVGRQHKQHQLGADDFMKMRDPFLKMVESVLEDRFNEKAETLFTKFFDFCATQMQTGLNS